MEKMPNNFDVVYILTKLELGGAQKVCLSLKQGLQKEGYNVSLITGNQGVLADQVAGDKSVFLLSSFKREVSIGSMWSELKTFFKMIKILRALKKKRPTLIVHTHSTKAGIIGRWAAFFAGISYRVHTVHGFGFNNYQSWPVWLSIFFSEYLTAFITTRYVCVSEADQREGCRLFPFFKEKNVIIRAAIDEKPFLKALKSWERKPQSHEFIIGTISCFKPQKNLIDLLKAFSFAQSKSSRAMRLQIVGDGVLRPELEAYIKQHNLEKCVDLLGWQKNVEQLVSSWNLFALSSLWEGLPCSVIEAQVCRIPVIAYDVGGIGEVIKNGVNGYVVTPKAHRDLGEKIALLADDNELYEKLKKSSLSLDEFYNTSMIRRHGELYAALVS